MLMLTLFALAVQADDAVRDAVKKAIPLLEKSGAQYVEAKSCFSCHHQAIPVFALLTAKARGFEVDENNLRAQIKFTWDSLDGAKKPYAEGKGQGGTIATASYALWTLDVAGWKPDQTTGTVAAFVASFDRDKDAWKPPSNRPPQEATAVTFAALSIRGLRTFGTEEQKGRIERARAWLLNAKAKDTEERVFRLRGLKDAGAEAADVEAAARELAATQREDGGWGQTDSMASDAYATGSALAALFEACGRKAVEENGRRGVKFLLGLQKEDGSWHVATRAKAVQKYFESGFPHGKDQFISISATGWAVAALALACDPSRR